jgi:hypothetical protein
MPKRDFEIFSKTQKDYNLKLFENDYFDPV